MERASALSDALNAASAWPADLTPLPPVMREHWLGYCISALNDAVAAKDLTRARRWAPGSIERRIRAA